MFFGTLLRFYWQCLSCTDKQTNKKYKNIDIDKKTMLIGSTDWANNNKQVLIYSNK